MKSKTLKTMYEALLSEREPKNCFRLPECNSKFFKIVEVCEVHMGNEKAEMIADMLSDLCEFVRETSFEAGFYSACDLQRK